MPKRTDINKILIIGSGPIIIGQACEFDYSGTQACKALRSLGYEIVLVNSNPATIMTDPETADVTYIEPLNVERLEQIIAKERPDALLPNLGGQSALNLCSELNQAGVLEKYNVQVIGVQVDAIERGEDRIEFKKAMDALGIEMARSEVAYSVDEALAIADKLGYPVVLRPAYTMGGAGGGLVYNKEELKVVCARGIQASLVGQVLVEESILGWEELEVEVVLEARNIGKLGMFENINFKAYKGEILGFYGLVGAGRTELARILIGADEMDVGEIYIHGEKVQISNVSDAVYKYGLSYVSENRKEEGLILPFSVQDNMLLTNLHLIRGRFGKLSFKKGKKLTESMINKMEIKTPSQETVIETLSGGNQQKVSLGKWLLTGSDIIIIDEPSVGVDVGVKRHIHELIWKLAKEEGKTVILISSDMPEMITLARRILVFRDYQIVDEIKDLNDKEHSSQEISERIGQAIA